MSRPARIKIDVAALRHNHRLLRRAHGGRVPAVLKADANGHCAERCASALAGGANGFAVEFGDEAAALRAAGVHGPLLFLEGVFGAPAMKARSEVIAVRDAAASKAIGYGARFVADRATRVGPVDFGYADGYPGAAGNRTPVAVDKQRTALIGRVSMDMLTVDLTGLPNAGMGSDVELWGAHIPGGDVAASAGTIAYVLLCNAKRAPRVTESRLCEGRGIERRHGGES